MRCRKPFFVQIEQLHSATCAKSAVMRNRTRPQWQPPSNFLMRYAFSVASSSAGYLSKAAVIGLAHHQDREGLQACYRLAFRMK
jgi:hypothetical protein